MLFTIFKQIAQVSLAPTATNMHESIETNFLFLQLKQPHIKGIKQSLIATLRNAINYQKLIAMHCET